MKIVKPLQIGLLHRSYAHVDKCLFTVSIPIAFSLIDGEILLEQKLWTIVGKEMAGEIFDAAMPKATGEVLVQGQFHGANNTQVTHSQVSLLLSRSDKQGHNHTLVDKTLNVFGERHWLPGGLKASAPELITELQIGYANAFGGEKYPANEIGKGHQASKGDSKDLHYLPNIEYPAQQLSIASNEAAPAAFGHVDVMAPKRLALAGTYDDKYLQEQLMKFAIDLDFHYFNDAAQDQWLPDYFVGDEYFSISNMHPEHEVLSCQLPAIYGRAFVDQTVFDKETQQSNTEFKEIKTHLDTLWLFPNEAVGVMIYRGTIEAYSDDGEDIQNLMVACEGRDHLPRSLEHYQQQMAKRICPEHGYKYTMFTGPLIANGMRCGFEQTQEEYDFPLEMLGKANMDEFTENHKQQALQQIQDAKAQLIVQLNLAGIDPQPHLDKFDSPNKTPEQIKVEALMEKMAPGLVTDPDNIDIFNMDLSVMDEIAAYLEEIKAQQLASGKSILNDQLIKLKAHPEASHFTEGINTMEKAIADIDLPTMWPRADLMAQLATVKTEVAGAHIKMDELRALGVAEDKLPKIDIDLVTLEQNLKEAQTKVKASYLMGAHLMGECRSPHPDKEAQLKSEFLTAFKTSKSLVDNDYACIDLRGENLSGIDLSGCYLEGVNFSGCNLTDAILDKAILSRANLSEAQLTQASCKGSNIGFADLTNTQFKQCNLNEAQLEGCTFTGAQFIECDMRNLILIDTEFLETDFSGSDLSKCNFIDPKFTDCSFEKANLSKANFVKGEFTRISFKQGTLEGANFVEATTQQINFSQAKMTNSRFVGNCQLDHANFSGAILNKSGLRENQLNYANFSGCKLDESDFGGAALYSACFTGASAQRSLFIKSQLANAQMDNVNLLEANVYKAYLVGTNFTNSNLYSANFLDATLGENKYWGANLDATILKDWRP